MARRMSNRDRIDQMRAEADAAAKEREAKRANRPARTASTRDRTAAAPASKVRLVWSVRNQRGDEVSFFPYAKQAEARAEAERLTEESERAHFVTQAEKPA